jgi:Zn-dependent protease
MVFMQHKEIRDIVISAVALAIAFGIAFGGGFQNIFESDFVTLFAISLVAVSLGFVLHELSHRYFARKFGYFAEFVMWPHGLLLALLFSMFGFVFAAPGAVMIHTKSDLWGNYKPITRRNSGILSIAGPLMNVSLAAVFIIVNFLVPSMIFELGARINIWLALFNMLPIPPLDGYSVLKWDKKIWIGVFAVIVAMFVLF